MIGSGKSGWGAAAIALALSVASGPAGALDATTKPPGWCKAAPSASDISQPLASLAQTLQRKGHLTVVAVGSSSTEGSDLPDRGLAYPTHTHARLNALLGAGRVTLVNRGRGGETVSDTVARFERDVLAVKPDLVIWQLGANDIVRRLPVAEVRAKVSAGLAKLKATGAAVLLMDSQNAPLILESPQRAAIDGMLREEGQKAGAAYWSRFAAMEAMVDRGDARPDDLIRTDRLHMTVAMHQCAGKLLADKIAAGLGTEPATVSTTVATAAR
jgi:lysophospholipase L1-like esterase